jgi:hypothetical protein
MPRHSFTWRTAAVLTLVALLFAALLPFAAAQTQEPKPELPPTPTAEPETQSGTSPDTGVSGNAWEGPNWGVRLTWDAAEWAVEAEQIVPGYDGLQIGTPRTTVFIEAYDGYGGDADACLADAEQEIRQREGVSEVVPLANRPLPVPEEARGPAQLFGVTAALVDGTTYRGVEYVECRTVVPGTAVVEITWQAVVSVFNQDLPLVTDLLASLVIPDAGQPAATPAVPLATPVA